jgi:DNA-binding CsgD family transcriptional regulator
MVGRLPKPVLSVWWEDQLGSPLGPQGKRDHSRGTCADSVLAVTLAVLRLVADGCPAEDAMCICLAQEVEADVAAYVSLTSAAGTASLVARPRSLDLPRAQVLLDELPAAAMHVLQRMAVDRRAHCLSGTAEALGRRHTVMALLFEDFVGCQDVAHLPLDVPGHGVRLLVLARRQRFDAVTMELLNRLRTPLTDVLRLASQPAPARERGRHDSPKRPAPGLTRRELEVLRLMAEGLLARTIATRLAISPRTVHKHVGNIYRKLEVHDRLAAVRLAERLGFLGPTP